MAEEDRESQSKTLQEYENENKLCKELDKELNLSDKDFALNDNDSQLQPNDGLCLYNGVDIPPMAYYHYESSPEKAPSTPDLLDNNSDKANRISSFISENSSSDWSLSSKSDANEKAKTTSTSSPSSEKSPPIASNPLSLPSDWSDNTSVASDSVLTSDLSLSSLSLENCGQKSDENPIQSEMSSDFLSSESCDSFGDYVWISDWIEKRTAGSEPQAMDVSMRSDLSSVDMTSQSLQTSKQMSKVVSISWSDSDSDFVEIFSDLDIEASDSDTTLGSHSSAHSSTSTADKSVISKASSESSPIQGGSSDPNATSISKSMS